MSLMEISRAMLTGKAEWMSNVSGDTTLLHLAAEGAGLDVTWLKETKERYIAFTM